MHWTQSSCIIQGVCYVHSLHSWSVVLFAEEVCRQKRRRGTVGCHSSHFTTNLTTTSLHPVSADSLVSIGTVLAWFDVTIGKSNTWHQTLVLFSVRLLACHYRIIMLIFTICSHQMCPWEVHKFLSWKRLPVECQSLLEWQLLSQRKDTYNSNSFLSPFPFLSFFFHFKEKV